MRQLSASAPEPTKGAAVGVASEHPQAPRDVGGFPLSKETFVLASTVLASTELASTELVHDMPVALGVR